MEKVVVETTYRVSDLLRRADTVREYFGKSLNADKNGLNIEGIAVEGDRLFLGLRAPVDGMAYIVEGSVSALFASGHKPLPPGPIPVPIPVPLGNKVGIRDLALLPDNRLLILAGAAYQPDIPYSIFLLDLTEKAPNELVPRQQDQPARAEGMTVLSATPQEIRVLLLLTGPSMAHRRSCVSLSRDRRSHGGRSGASPPSEAGEPKTRSVHTGDLHQIVREGGRSAEAAKGI
jgi:hypothetical protein